MSISELSPDPFTRSSSVSIIGKMAGASIQISPEFLEFRLPGFVDPEDPDETTMVPIWVGDAEQYWAEFDVERSLLMYAAWMEFYSPGELGDVDKKGTRIRWLEDILNVAADPAIRRRGLRDQPRYGEYPNVSWLYLPWNLNFPVEEMRDDMFKMEVCLWLAMQFLVHMDDGILRTSESVVRKDTRVIVNRNYDGTGEPIVPRVERYHEFLDQIWTSILREGKPLTGRQVLEKIVLGLMPRGLRVEIRRAWWDVVKYTFARGFTEREDAYSRNGISIRLRAIARHLRYHLMVHSGDPQIIRDHTDGIPWGENAVHAGNLVADAPEYTYFPIHDPQVRGSVPTELFLYTDEAAALVFAGACAYCFARAAYSGIMIPYSVHLGWNVGQPMGEANLPQHRHTPADFQIEVVALNGREAALHIQRRRKVGGVPSEVDIRVLKVARDQLLKMQTTTDAGRRQKERYLRWFAAVLREEDRIERGNLGMREWANIAQPNPNLYDTPEEVLPTDAEADRIYQKMESLFLGR